MKLMSSGRTIDAAIRMSPSFSRFSSSMRMTILPALKSARISSVESSLLDRASSIFAILFMFIPRVHPAQDGAFHGADFQNRQIAYQTASFLLSSNRSRSEEHTSELQSLMSISYAVFCLTKQTKQNLKPYH